MTPRFWASRSMAPGVIWPSPRIVRSAFRCSRTSNPRAKFPAPICPIGAGNFALGFEVREQRKADLTILGEGQMTPGAIDRDAQNLGVMFEELRHHLLVQDHLVAADGT